MSRKIDSLTGLPFLRDYLSVRRAAREFITKVGQQGVTPQRIYQLIKKGDLRAYKIPDGIVVLRRKDLRSYMAQYLTREQIYRYDKTTDSLSPLSPFDS